MVESWTPTWPPLSVVHPPSWEIFIQKRRSPLYVNWFTTTQKTLSKASFLMHQILASKIVHSFEIETEISFAKWAFSLCTVTLTFHFCLPILLPFCLLIYACKALPNMLCMNQGSKKERVNILNLFKVNDTWRGGIGPSTQQKCWGSSCYGF